jgi:outer membrane protein assembly factor BamB
LKWSATLEFEPTFVERWKDRVVLAGADGAVALRLSDGKRAWSFAVPSRRWPTASVVAGVPKVEHFAAGIRHAALWSDTLLLLDDDRHFLRLNLDTGETVWQFASPAASMRPLDAAAFSPHVTRVGERLIVQSFDGQPHSLGATLAVFGENSRAWRQVPRVGDGRIFIAAERGAIHAFDAAKPAAPAWVYQPSFATSLAGDLCRLDCEGSALLAVVPRNDGHDWIRLDMRTGKLVWSQSVRETLGGWDEGSVQIGDTAFYYVTGDQLIARSLNSGAVMWTRTLESGADRWMLRYTPDVLAVYPRTIKDTDFAVGFFDPFDGRWLQRLTFAGGRGGASVLWTLDGAIVLINGKVFGFRSLNVD